ncbi:MAG: hypothetical protein R2911_19970 [Caldilineaceae bacterium]
MNHVKSFAPLAPFAPLKHTVGDQTIVTASTSSLPWRKTMRGREAISFLPLILPWTIGFFGLYFGANFGVALLSFYAMTL